MERKVKNINSKYNLKSFQDDEDDKMSQGTTDEVDGSSRRKSSSTSQIVDAFFKLAFLKILIVDIGISIGKLSSLRK